MGQSWQNCEPQIKNFVQNAAQVFVDQIPGTLDSIYLHGSLAMGCFYAPKSDIDLLILVKEPLTLEEQKSIHQQMIIITDRRPIVGFVEFSVVLSEIAKNPQHPIAYELHYGEEFPEKIRSGAFNYATSSKGNDVDLAAHFRVTKARGLALYGALPRERLGDVAWKDYLNSIIEDLNWILAEENILESPFYGVLNCCRVIQTLTEGEGTVASKEEGAIWALKNMNADREHKKVIELALDTYRSEKHIEISERKTGGTVWSEVELLRFRDYVRTHVNSLYKK